MNEMPPLIDAQRLTILTSGEKAVLVLVWWSLELARIDMAVSADQAGAKSNPYSTTNSGLDRCNAGVKKC